MEDINKCFEEYTPKWCKEHKLPTACLKKSKYWQQAWQDFMQDVLLEQYEERKQEFLNIELLSSKTMNNKVEEEEEAPTNNWQDIQQYLK